MRYMFNHKNIFIDNYFRVHSCAGVVPDGTYEVCSRTTGQAAAGRFAVYFETELGENTMGSLKCHIYELIY